MSSAKGGGDLARQGTDCSVDLLLSFRLALDPSLISTCWSVFAEHLAACLSACMHVSVQGCLYVHVLRGGTRWEVGDGGMRKGEI